MQERSITQVEGSDIDGGQVTIKLSKPAQLSLFQTFLPHDADQYSNSIELYDSCPKYYDARWQRNQRQAGSFLKILERSFHHRGKGYQLKISPARIEQKDHNEIEFYPSQREHLIEEALRKIACEQTNGIYLNDGCGVQFTLNSLRKELKRLGHTMKLESILESINICNKVNLQVSTSDGKHVLKSAIFPTVLISNRHQWLKDPNNTFCYVAFNPLVTNCLAELSYRQFNYNVFMKLSSHLSKWLHRRLSHMYTQANLLNPYTIKMSTIIRDSGLVNSKRLTECARHIEKTLNELLENDVLLSYQKHKSYGERHQLLDTTYTLTPSSKFVSEIKQANKRFQQQELLKKQVA